MEKMRFLLLAIALLFAISLPMQLVAQNDKLLKEAENGSGEAQAKLATYYFKGIEGFERDVEKCKYWTAKAQESAQAGSWEAQAWLAARMFLGDQMYFKNVNYAKQWADVAMNNPKLKGEERTAFMEFRKQIVAEFEKDNPSMASSEIKRFKSMPQVGTDHLPTPFTTEEMLIKIRNHDDEGLDRLNIERLSGYNTSTYAFHCELKWFAIDKSTLIKGFGQTEKIKMDDLKYSEQCKQAYWSIKEIANQGNKEAQDFLNNPTPYFRIMDNTGRIFAILKNSGKADDFISKFDADYLSEIAKSKEEYENKAKKHEDDIINFLYAGDEYLRKGTVLHKKNGVLKVNSDDMTSRQAVTFTMNDGSIYEGTFKDIRKINSYKLLESDELTPWDGKIQYADGTEDYISSGVSRRAQVKAEEAEKEKKREAMRAEQAKILKSYQQKLSQLGQKYGTANINNLKSAGTIKVGYSVAMLDAYLKVYNQYMEDRVKVENGRHNPLALHYYEPSVSEVLKYGKTAKRVKVFGTWFANEIVVGNFMMANGKVAAIYQQTSIPIK